MTIRTLLVALVLLSSAAAVRAWDDELEDVQLMEAPLLGPPRLNLYGPGLHGDATGRPFRYETESGEALTIEPMRPNAYGLGVGMDVYGRPVRARPWP